MLTLRSQEFLGFTKERGVQCRPYGHTPVFPHKVFSDNNRITNFATTNRKPTPTITYHSDPKLHELECESKFGHDESRNPRCSDVGRWHAKLTLLSEEPA